MNCRLLPEAGGYLLIKDPHRALALQDEQLLESAYSIIHQGFMLIRSSTKIACNLSTYLVYAHIVYYPLQMI